MEEKAVPLPAQFGSFAIPAARAIPTPSSFVGVTFSFVGHVSSILDSDPDAFSIAGTFSMGDPVTGSITYDDHIDAAGPDGTRGLYPKAPAATLTIGSCFTESLPFAQSLPGLEMVVQKETGGHSLNFESDFSLVRGPVFPTNVEAAMVISLSRSSGGAFLNDAPPSRIALDDFDDTHFLITFFDTASGNVSFLEVALEQFTAEGVRKSKIRESFSGGRRDVSEVRESKNVIPHDRRLTLRRVQSDRRATLRRHPNGGDRRHGPGRRKEDKRDTMKTVLSGLFSVPTGRMRPRKRDA
jgi:hypothetical protein